MTRRRRLAIVLAMLPMTAAAQALIEWKGDARYDKGHTVAAGKFVELCAKLGAGARVEWSFAADEPLDFNVHYHVGDRVEYPAKADGSRRESGVLVVPKAQDYCWMWTNRGATPSQVTVELDPAR